MNTTDKPIDVPATITHDPQQTAALVTREASPVAATFQSRLSMEQVRSALAEIKAVMRECMTEGHDYGKIPGCGDRVSLFQPGAQKLGLMFHLNPQVREETIVEYPDGHRGYRMIVRVTSGTKFADGVSERSTMETKWRYKAGMKSCPICHAAAIGNSKQGPERYFCWTKKGGCGARFMPGAPDTIKIDNQPAGNIENNPADMYNTVRKMTFKCAFVMATINATNSSEIWSEELDEPTTDDGTVDTGSPKATPQAPVTPPRSQHAPTPHSTAQENQNRPTATPAPQKPPVKLPSEGGWRSVSIPFGKNKGKLLGELKETSLDWYLRNAEIKQDGSGFKDTPFRRSLDFAIAELFPDGLPDKDEQTPF